MTPHAHRGGLGGMGPHSPEEWSRLMSATLRMTYRRQREAQQDALLKCVLRLSPPGTSEPTFSGMVYREYLKSPVATGLTHVCQRQAMNHLRELADRGAIVRVPTSRGRTASGPRGATSLLWSGPNWNVAPPPGGVPTRPRRASPRHDAAAVDEGARA